MKFLIMTAACTLPSFTASCTHTRRWWKETDPCQSPLTDALKAGKIWANTKEIYHL